MTLEFTDKNLIAYFEYLRSILYGSDSKNIDLGALSNDEFRDFAKALTQFGDMVNETREFAFSLSRGELDSAFPSAGNELAAPLKSLHATLRHLTWQAKQISGGDYDQRVAFMGEFSVSFNEMVAQLAGRSREMAAESTRNKERLEELAKTNSIFEVITSNMEEWIVMVDRNTGERLFANHSPESVLASDTLEQQLYSILFDYASSMSNDDEPAREEFTLISDTALQHFEMMLYPIRWFERDAVACVMIDITANKEEFNRLEDAAYKDVMTGVYNRLYGMKLLDEYANARTPFQLVFVDMDMLKYVNDVFGHAEGDAYIQSVADLLQEVSPLATICRLGGDEFMVLIKECDLHGRDMRKVFEELRIKLANTSKHEEASLPFYHRSISFGIIEIGEDNELSTSDILAAADERMYQYKKAHKQERRV